MASVPGGGDFVVEEKTSEMRPSDSTIVMSDLGGEPVPSMTLA
jgi:hypothetical protein